MITGVVQQGAASRYFLYASVTVLPSDLFLHVVPQAQSTEVVYAVHSRIMLRSNHCTTMAAAFTTVPLIKAAENSVEDAIALEDTDVV